MRLDNARSAAPPGAGQGRRGVRTGARNGAAVSSDCTWKFTGGTGKLSGLKGKGSCKGTFQPDGKAAWVIKGEYHLATATGT